MTDKELRQLNRAELIDIIYELQKRNKRCMEQNQKLQDALDDRVLRLNQSGSIAEAALKVNGIFESAQAAADQYLCSVRAQNADLEQKKEKMQKECDTMLQTAEQKARKIVADAEEHARQITAEADKQAEEKWSRFQQKAQELIRVHEELQALVRKA